MAHYTTKVKPTRLETAAPEALAINGFAAHPELWDNAPTFDDVARDVADLLEGAILVGHNVRFDAAFLSEALRRSGIQARIDYHMVDTIVLAHEHLVPCGLEFLKLDAVRDFLGISKEGAHTALKDALDARLVHKTLARATAFDRLRWRLGHAARNFRKRA